MDSVVAFFAGFGLDFWQLCISAAVLLVGSIVFGSLGRFVFGEKSMLGIALSSAIGILFVYALNIVLSSAGSEYAKLATSLPFITLGEGQVFLYNFFASPYTVISYQVLSMIILAFLVNLADELLPVGKNLLTWTFFRTATVVLAQAAHLIVVGLLGRYLPEGLITYAPVVLLAVLALMLLTGSLKIIVGVAISTVNPLIAALYTFFFANIIGKQITKAVLTTGILSLTVMALRYFGITVISTELAALVAYIPFAILLLVLWYVILLIFRKKK